MVIAKGTIPENYCKELELPIKHIFYKIRKQKKQYDNFMYASLENSFFKISINVPLY
jgi:hypothetical protein